MHPKIQRKMNPMVINDFTKLVKILKGKKHKVIAIDGRDGSGKTYLSKQLHEKLGGSLLSEKSFRSASLDERFEYNKNKILQELASGLKKPPVIFESCFMHQILKDLGLKPGVIIYIKTLSESTNQWTDEDELALEPNKKLAVEKEQNFGKSIGIPPSNFRIQMIEYHYDFEPHTKSDVIYERVEKYE